MGGEIGVQGGEFTTEAQRQVEDGKKMWGGGEDFGLGVE